MKIDERHLVQLAAVVKAGGVTEGAALLGLSQPAISRTIAMLERRLGEPLFVKGRRPLQPTPLGRALADPRRVEILALVGRGVGRSNDLVGSTGLTRSTVHHHLAQLRAAGLVGLEGNARAYVYVPRRDAPGEIAERLATIVGTEGQ